MFSPMSILAVSTTYQAPSGQLGFPMLWKCPLNIFPAQQTDLFMSVCFYSLVSVFYTQEAVSVYKVQWVHYLLLFWCFQCLKGQFLWCILHMTKSLLGIKIPESFWWLMMTQVAMHWCLPCIGACSQDDSQAQKLWCDAEMKPSFPC